MSAKDFLRRFPAIPDEGLREMRVPRPPPGETVDMAVLAAQLDCCDWQAFTIVGHVERAGEVLSVHECDNGHRWALVYEDPA